MSKNYSVIFALSFVFALGCSDDSGFQSNDGSVRIDGGAGQDGAAKDGSTSADAAAALSCAEVLSCANQCGQDTACANACILRGSAEAQVKLNAINACFSKEAGTGGSCATECKDQKAPACSTCLVKACDKERVECLGGGGPAEAGFGDACNPAASTCKNGLVCAPASATTGFCSKTCTNQGGLCQGAASGQQAACVYGVQDQNKNVTIYCAFLCSAQGGSPTFDCPSALQCATQDNPPGSGQKMCMPK
jgi:hypothetical protein